MKDTKDNIQFRILYFLGICLIIAGHCDGLSIPLFQKWFPNYSFHIGLFVFCSGYFFINNKNKRILKFVKKITKKFLIPLYTWNLIYGIIITILHQYGIKFGVALDWKSLLIMPLYDGHQFVFNLSSWFIIPLYFLQLINIFVIKILKKKDCYYYINFIVSTIIGFIGLDFSIKGYNTGFFLFLVRLAYFAPFFALGMLYKNNLEKYDKLNNLKYFAILFFISLIVILHYGGEKAYTPSLGNDFDNFYRPFIAGFLGIAFWLRVSKILIPILQSNQYVMKISKNTFSIMMHHLAGFFLLNTIFNFINIYIRNLPSFDYVEYINNIWYRYLPRGIENFNLVYGIFGILFSLYVNRLTQTIKKWLTEKNSLIYNKISGSTIIDLSIKGLYQKSYIDY